MKWIKNYLQQIKKYVLHARNDNESKKILIILQFKHSRFWRHLHILGCPKMTQHWKCSGIRADSGDKILV